MNLQSHRKKLLVFTMVRGQGQFWMQSQVKISGLNFVTPVTAGCTVPIVVTNPCLLHTFNSGKPVFEKVCCGANLLPTLLEIALPPLQPLLRSTTLLVSLRNVALSLILWSRAPQSIHVPSGVQLLKINLMTPIVSRGRVRTCESRHHRSASCVYSTEKGSSKHVRGR